MKFVWNELLEKLFVNINLEKNLKNYEKKILTYIRFGNIIFAKYSCILCIDRYEIDPKILDYKHYSYSQNL